MIVFGSEFVEFEPVEIVKFSGENIKNGSKFVMVSSKKEAIFANANGVEFIVCENFELAKILQSVADDYIFDAKIALIISGDAELDLAIDARIDAVIYKKILKN